MAYETLKKTKAKLDTISTQLLLMEEYDIVYGIHDHNKRYPGVEMPLMAMHVAEDSGVDSPLYESMTGFAHSGIFKHFGVNFIDFLNLPRDYCEELTRIAKQLEKEVADTSAAAYEELKAARDAHSNQMSLF